MGLSRLEAAKFGRVVAVGVGLAVLVLTSGLVLSGHLPPRALVTGTVFGISYGVDSATPGVKLSFREEGGSTVVVTEASTAGHFSVTLPPGLYQVTAPNITMPDSLRIRGHGSPYGVAPVVSLKAGEHIAVDFEFETGAICLAAGDQIATPSGPVAVEQLRQGMLVWTRDAAGRRIAAPVLVVVHRQAPRGLHILRIVLSDGRAVEASAGHPTTDGRHIGDLKMGDGLDGSRLTRVELIPYVGDTWDLLPAGPNGDYWANGVLLGSTVTGR
jgi:hypothetical protein